MRIALDAMGTDSRPEPDVAGAVMAAKEFGDTIILVGPKSIIEAELKKHAVDQLAIEIVDAPSVVAMEEKPSVVLQMPDKTSMHRGMQLVKDGQADAFVTMGNTGAAMAIATLKTLRRIAGVKRPALTSIFPIYEKKIIFLDIGANADAKPEWLYQFATMGSIYAQSALGYSTPRVATLSIGEEEGKGNQLLTETEALLRKADEINYIGHVEPKEILRQNAEVIVFDGFVGNVFLKTFEGAITYFGGLLRDELESSLMTKLGALLLRPSFRRVRQKLETGNIGGAPLLGVNGVVIIGHGGSNATSIKNAIGQARVAVAGQTVELLRQHFASKSVVLG